MSDDVLRSDLAQLRDTVHAGFAEMAQLRDTVHAGFARMDRYFELMQAQHVELRGEVNELRGEVNELRADVRELRGLLLALTARVDRIEERLGALEGMVFAFRDWATGEFADVRREIRLLRHATEDRDAGLRRDVDALDARLTRLERRWEEGGDRA